MARYWLFMAIYWLYLSHICSILAIFGPILATYSPILALYCDPKSKHTAQTKLSPVTTILDIWQTAEGPPSAGSPFLTLLYNHERFVPPDHYLQPIGGLEWQHKAPRIIESVSFREYPPAGPTQFNLCHFLA